MPSIKSPPLGEVETETVVPGQTRTSLPRVRRRMAVSSPAVMEDPDATRLPVSTNDPDVPMATGTAAGCTPAVNAGTDGGLAVAASSALTRMRRRLPMASHVYLTGAARSTTTRVTAGLARYWSARMALIC